MAIDLKKVNGIFYLNKNKELHFRNFEVLNNGQGIFCRPNEKHIIIGVYIDGRNVSSLDPSNDSPLPLTYYEETNKQLTPIEVFLCQSKRNVFFQLSDVNYRTENTIFIINISRPK